MSLIQVIFAVFTSYVLICCICTYADLCTYMYIGKNYIYIGKNAQNNSDNLLQAVGAGWRVQTCLNWAWKVSKSLIKKMVEIFSSFLIALISTNCAQLFGKFIPTKCFFHPPPPLLCGTKIRLDHPVSTKGRKSVGRIFFRNHPPTPRM